MILSGLFFVALGEVSNKHMQLSSQTIRQEKKVAVNAKINGDGANHTVSAGVAW